MRLNHLDLSVPDVDAEAAFLQRFFGFHLLQRKGQGGMAILQGEDGFALVLTRMSTTVAEAYPKTFHIGFLVGSAAEVHAMHRRLSEAALPECSPVGEQRGSVLFYCRSPGGLLVEVGHRPDAGLKPSSAPPAP
jgi:catechol 2,3-dioxygenase-like lactoylglutathione lyase family enzyme